MVKILDWLYVKLNRHPEPFPSVMCDGAYRWNCYCCLMLQLLNALNSYVNINRTRYSGKIKIVCILIDFPKRFPPPMIRLFGNIVFSLLHQFQFSSKQKLIGHRPMCCYMFTWQRYGAAFSVYFANPEFMLEYHYRIDRLVSVNFFISFFFFFLNIQSLLYLNVAFQSAWRFGRWVKMTEREQPISSYNNPSDWSKLFWSKWHIKLVNNAFSWNEMVIRSR